MWWLLLSLLVRESDRGIEESDCMGLMREERELICLYYLML